MYDAAVSDNAVPSHLLQIYVGKLGALEWLNTAV